MMILLIKIRDQTDLCTAFQPEAITLM